MKKTGKLLIGLSISMLLSISAVSAAGTFTCDFDDLDYVDFTEGSTEDVSSINTEFLTFERDANGRVAIQDAQTGKLDGTSLTDEGETDKCVLLQNSLSSTQNAKIYINLPVNKNDEQYIDTEKDIKISFNLKAGRTYKTTHNLGYVAICDGAGNSKNLIEYEGVKSGPIKTTLLGVSAGTISDGWHYYEIVLHTEDKTVEISRDGEAIFDNPVSIGDSIIFDSESGEGFNRILFATNSTINKTDETGDVLRIDDITVTNIDSISEFKVSQPGVYVGDELVTQFGADTAVVGKVHVSVPENISEEKTVTLIAAVYDETGTIVNVYLSDIKTYAVGENAVEEDIILDLPSEGNKAGYFVKVFAWDSMSGMNKLSDTVGKAEIVE